MGEKLVDTSEDNQMPSSGQDSSCLTPIGVVRALYRLSSLGIILLLTISTSIFIAHAQEGETRVPVVVARQPIPRGTVLIPDNLYGDNPLVEVQFWQPEFAPKTAYRRIEDVEGLVAKIDLTARMPLLAGNLTTDSTLTAPIGSDTALVIPLNRRGVPLRVENLYTAPPTLTELDCVDIVAVFDFGREELQTRFTVGTGGIVVENIGGSGRVTVALEPEAAVIAVWMQDNDIPLALEYCPTTPSG